MSPNKMRETRGTDSWSRKEDPRSLSVLSLLSWGRLLDGTRPDSSVLVEGVTEF